MVHPDPFDPETLRFNGASFRPAETTKRLPRHQPGQLFLKGPIPWQWLAAAGRLPGKALLLSLFLWREAGRHKRRTVKLCLGRIGTGVSRYAARRALRNLEGAGLVSILRRSGRGLEVTLQDAPEPYGD